MKKILKSSLALISATSFVTPTTILISSCSNGKVSEFSIGLTQSYIMPGEELTMRCYTSPSKIKNNQVEWTIIDSPSDKVRISNDGILSVEKDLVVDKPINFGIVGTLKSDSSLYDAIDVSLVPKTDKNVLGFVDNKIYFVNRTSELDEVEITKLDDSTYTNSTPIDLFTADVLPQEFNSWINFKPIIRTKQEPEMHFEYGKGPSQHSIQWEGYENGEMTVDIPMFRTINFENPTDFIKVTFECDETVSLIIKFNIWMDKRLLSPGVFSYNPVEIDDPYHIEPYQGRSDGAYRANLRAKREDKAFGNFFAPILCHRKPHEYLDFDFYIVKNPELVKRNAFGLNWGYTKYVRPLDNYPTYVFDMTCIIVAGNLTDFYETTTDIVVFTIEAYDKLDGKLWCYCDFVLEWYD